MSFASSAAKLLTNKYVLYFVVFLAITNVLGYIMIGQFKTVIFFALTSLLTSYFSNNMIVILLVGLITTNLFVSGSILQQQKIKVKEGLENKESEVKKDVTKIETKTASVSTSGIDREDDEERLREVDAQLKKGIDVLRDMKGDVTKAKEVLENNTATIENIKTVIGDEIKDPNNPTMNKKVEGDNDPKGKSETTTKSTQGFKNISGSPFR